MGSSDTQVGQRNASRPAKRPHTERPAVGAEQTQPRTARRSAVQTTATTPAPANTLTRVNPLEHTDVYGPRDTPNAVILVWHGSGANERHVLQRLAEHLATRTNSRVVVPNWNSQDPDHGASRLFDSLRYAQHLAVEHDTGLTLVGWSLGATAALSVALEPERFGDPQPRTVVGLAAASEHDSPLAPRRPSDTPITPDGPRIALIHGREDDIVDSAEAERFRARCAQAGRPASLVLIGGDHASVVGCRFDEGRDECVPSDDDNARAALEAVVAAVTDADPTTTG